jgi:hypothetical protein
LPRTSGRDRIQKVIKRRKYLPKETLIEIKSSEYDAFTVDSIVDCNVCYVKSPEEILRKTKSGEVRLREEMDLKIIEKLRNGFLRSPMIEKSLKNILLL